MGEQINQSGRESRRERFLRLAPRRVDKALSAIRRIGNLAAPTYESTEAERQKIIDAIFAAANELKENLEGKSKQHEPFSFWNLSALCNRAMKRRHGSPEVDKLVELVPAPH